MANYNKSFNFRNGVQVDVQSLLVNSNGLVGIGTTIPRTDLDVYGNISATGVITTKNIFSTGISTFSTVKVGSAITMDSISGIISAAVFLGDGSQLRGIPTSQWIDYTGPGLTSAYTLRNLVGIGTSAVSSSLQVGGRFEFGQKGVGISSDGNIAASGIITASVGLYGPGSNITAINASNISSGTLNNSRLPSNINLPTGITTVGTASITNAVIGISTLNSNGIVSKNITGTSFTGGSFYATGPVEISSSSNLLFSGGSGISIAGNTGTAGQFFVANGSGGIYWSSSISLTGVTTVGLLSARDVFVAGFTTTSGIKATTGIVTDLSVTFLKGVFAGDIQNLYSTGIATINNASIPYLNTTGIATATTLNATTATITSLTANLSGNSSVGSLNAGIATITDLIVSRNVNISGVTTTKSLKSSELNSTGIVTASSFVAGNLKINNSANKIESVSGDLTLDAQSTQVSISNNLVVTGNTNLTGIATVVTGLIPDFDKDAYLGSSSKAFANAYIEEIQIGTSGNTINTRSGGLKLDSSNQYVEVTNDLRVNRNSLVSGISTITGVAVLNTGATPVSDGGAYLGQASNAFSTIHVGLINLAYSSSNTINTRSGNLALNSYTQTVEILNDILVDRNATVSGIATFNSILKPAVGLLPTAANNVYLGSSAVPFSSLYVQNINIGDSGATNTISTKSGNLSLDAVTGIVAVPNNLRVTGTSVFTGITSVGSGLLPSTNLSGSLGSSSKAFSGAYLSNVRVAVADANTIDTSSGDLNLNSSSGNVTVSKLQASGISNFNNNVIFGSSAGVFVDSLNSRVGIGTSIPSTPFQVRNTGSLRAEFLSNTNATIGIGISPVGSGASTGNISYSNGNLSLSNEQSGNIQFNLHTGNPGVNTTGKFVWYHYQTSTNLMTLSYNGNLAVGVANTQYRLRVGSPVTGINTSLQVDGGSYIGGDSTIAGFTTFVAKDIQNNFTFDPSNGTVTVKNLVVNGTTTGVTASGTGITFTWGSYNFGTIDTLQIGKGLDASVTAAGRGTVAISTSVYGIDRLGIGTNSPKAVLDVNKGGDASALPCFLPPRMTTSQRDADMPTPIEGALIYNTTTKTHQGWNGTIWKDFY